jgi:glucan biosynthesis protein C
MLLLALVPLLESAPGRRLRSAFLRLRGVALRVLPAMPLLVADLWLSGRYPENHALIGDWYAHAIYLCVFFYGYLLGTDADLWSELARRRRRSLALALTCLALYPIMDKFADDLLGAHPLSPATLLMAKVMIGALRYFYCWIAIMAVLGWGHALLNRPFRWLPHAGVAVYPWCVLHQSLLLLVAWQLMPLGLGPVLEPTLILLGTVAGCALLHEGIIRRVRWLRPLFGLECRESRQKRMQTCSRLADALV